MEVKSRPNTRNFFKFRLSLRPTESRSGHVSPTTGKTENRHAMALVMLRLIDPA